MHFAAISYVKVVWLLDGGTFPHKFWFYWKKKFIFILFSLGTMKDEGKERKESVGKIAAWTFIKCKIERERRMNAWMNSSQGDVSKDFSSFSYSFLHHWRIRAVINLFLLNFYSFLWCGNFFYRQSLCVYIHFSFLFSLFSVRFL